MEPRKRKTLTLEDRIGVIQLADAGVSARTIAKQYDVGKTQILVTMNIINKYCKNKQFSPALRMPLDKSGNSFKTESFI